MPAGHAEARNMVFHKIVISTESLPRERTHHAEHGGPESAGPME